MPPSTLWSPLNFWGPARSTTIHWSPPGEMKRIWKEIKGKWKGLKEMKATRKKNERKMKGRKESGDGPNLGRRNYFEAPFRFQFFASFQNFHEFWRLGPPQTISLRKYSKLRFLANRRLTILKPLKILKQRLPTFLPVKKLRNNS